MKEPQAGKRSVLLQAGRLAYVVFCFDVIALVQLSLPTATITTT